jgi:hypothetical protein
MKLYEIKKEKVITGHVQISQDTTGLVYAGFGRPSQVLG